MEIDELVSCISRALSTFGTNLEMTTYASLRRKGISIHDVLSDPEALLAAIKEVFGPGYVLVEREMVKDIKTTLEPFSPLCGSYRLVDAIEAAKVRIALTSGNEEFDNNPRNQAIKIIRTR